MRLSNLSIGASVALILSGAVASAQSFDVGSNAFNVGIGLGGYRYSYYTGTGTYRSSPTLGFSYERGVTEIGPGVLGIGGLIAFKTVKHEYSYSYWWGDSYQIDELWTNTTIGVRGSWHWNEWHGNDKLDLYAGVMLGYNIGSYKNNSTITEDGVTRPYNNYRSSVSSSFATYGAYAGCRYLFTEKFGVYGELGYGIAYLNAGVTLVL